MADREITPSLAQSLMLQAIEQLTAVGEQIGVLQGQMNLVIAESQKASDKRERMYEKLNKIDGIESDLKRIIPLVDKHEERHNQAVGAMHFGKWMWTLVAGGVGAAIITAFEWFTGLHPGGHH